MSTPKTAVRTNRRVWAAAVGGTVLMIALLRRRYLRWGATAAERRSVLLGDELLPAADLVATRAISISAAPQALWPWIAQLGQGRGGFYSYDFLENLVGCDLHSASRIHPEWQSVPVGTEVRLAPQVPLAVAAVEPGAGMVLRGGIPMGTVAAPYDFTWSFVVHPQPDGTSRLVVRERYRYNRPWAPLIVQPAELVSCLMSVRMLRGIKTRTERALPQPVSIFVTPHRYRPQPGSYCDVDQRADAVQASTTRG